MNKISSKQIQNIINDIEKEIDKKIKDIDDRLKELINKIAEKQEEIKREGYKDFMKIMVIPELKKIVTKLEHMKKEVK